MYSWTHSEAQAVRVDCRPQLSKLQQAGLACVTNSSKGYIDTSISQGYMGVL